MKRKGNFVHPGTVKRTNLLQAAPADPESVYGGQSTRIHDRPYLYRNPTPAPKEVKQVFYTIDSQADYDTTSTFTTITIAQGSNNYNRVGRSVMVLGINWRITFDAVDSSFTHGKDILRFVMLHATGGAAVPATDDTWADVYRSAVTQYADTDLLAGQSAPKYSTLVDLCSIVNGGNGQHVDNIKTYAGSVDKRFVMSFDDGGNFVERNAVCYGLQGHHSSGGCPVRAHICLYFVDL